MTEHKDGIEYDKIEIIKETTSGTKTQKTDEELRINAETLKMLKKTQMCPMVLVTILQYMEYQMKREEQSQRCRYRSSKESGKY
jgi:hypothetical protein